MIFTCCDHPDGYLRQVSYVADSSTKHTVDVEWVCMSCGASIRMEGITLNSERMAIIDRARQEAGEHRFTRDVRRRYAHDNELDAENGGPFSPATFIRKR